MWISKRMVKNDSTEIIEGGAITMSKNNEIEAVSNGTQRSIKQYSPFGYSCSVPTGEEVLLTRLGGEKASVGVEMKHNKLKLGEIKITSKSGAYIYLRNNGSVVINGLEINSKGEIVNG